MDCEEGYENRVEHQWGNWRLNYSSDRIYALNKLRELTNTFSNSFNEDTLRCLCAIIDINYQDINVSNNIKKNFIELLIFTKDRGKLKNLINKVLNLNINIDLSLIDFSELENVNFSNLSFDIIESSCDYVRLCKRCKEEEYRNVHNYIRTNRVCDIYNICNICGHEEYIDTRHNLTTFEYISPTSCKKERHCLNPLCDHKELQDDHGNHSWSKWGYIEPKSCVAERSCQRCNKKEKQNIHQWSDEYKTEKGVTFKRFSRCQELDISAFQGIWNGLALFDSGGQEYWVLKLELCRPGLFSMNNIKGTLSTYEENRLLANLTIKGNLNTNTGQLDFKGKITESVKGYKADTFEGYLSDNCTLINGKLFSDNENGKIELR